MAMISLNVPDDISNQLAKIKVPGEKEKKEGYHITMFYFDEDYVKIEKVLKIFEACVAVAKNASPLSIRGNESTAFPEGKYGFPVIIPIESDELQQFRKKLAKRFDSDGVEYDKKWPDYKPHLTLSYSPKEYETKPLPKPISWKATEIILWAGDSMEGGLMCSIPLGIKKHSQVDTLYRTAQLFEKLI